MAVVGQRLLTSSTASSQLRVTHWTTRVLVQMLDHLFSLLKRIDMYRIVMPDGTFRIANSVAERNQIIAEMKEAYAGHYNN